MTTTVGLIRSAERSVSMEAADEVDLGSTVSYHLLDMYALQIRE